MRTGKDAIDWALSQSTYTPSGMCLQFTRLSFGLPAKYRTAALAWHNAERQHEVRSGSEVPAGVPVFWLGGSKGYGHAAVSLGGGLCRSTDWPKRYSVGTARIDDITRAWGLDLVGWTEDLNGYTVWESARPKLHARNVARGTRQRRKIPQGILLKRAVAKEVGRGFMRLNTKKLGRSFRRRYKKVQQKYFDDIGATPRTGDIDGIPGVNSLRWLGERHGFDVRE